MKEIILIGENMTDSPDSPKHSRLEVFLDELKEKITDPIHLRLIKAYQSPDPVTSMETELGKILMEVVKSED